MKRVENVEVIFSVAEIKERLGIPAGAVADAYGDPFDLYTNASLANAQAQGLGIAARAGSKVAELRFRFTRDMEPALANEDAPK